MGFDTVQLKLCYYAEAQLGYLLLMNSSGEPALSGARVISIDVSTAHNGDRLIQTPTSGDAI